MSQFLRKFFISERRFITRAVIGAAVSGSSLLHAYNDSDSGIPVSVDIPALRTETAAPVSGSPMACSIRHPTGTGDGSNCMGRDTLASAVSRVAPAVVHLSVLPGFNGIKVGEIAGSGTIIDPDGTILTCAHVLSDSRGGTYGTVAVTLQDGRNFRGKVVNVDPHHDIAIVKVESPGVALPSAVLGTSSLLRPGHWVVAVGCPLSLQNTVTAGIISCIDRKSSDLGLAGVRREYLQTDCAINNGNSGGPLINVDGEVIGVNTMKVAAAAGLSFSVPVDSVRNIMDHFRRRGRVIRPWLGVQVFDFDPTVAAHLRDRSPMFPDDVSAGVLVTSVTPRSPAYRSGIHPGDVIIEFDRRPVQTINEVIELMGDKVGMPFAVVVRRGRVTLTLSVVPEEANTDVL